MLAAALVASMSLLLPHVVSTGSSVCCVPLGQGRFQEGSVGGLEFSGGGTLKEALSQQRMIQHRTMLLQVQAVIVCLSHRGGEG